MVAYRTIEPFRQIYDEWKNSGLSDQLYCENIGLTESRFYYWKAKLKAESLPAVCGGIIPVTSVRQVLRIMVSNKLSRYIA